MLRAALSVVVWCVVASLVAAGLVARLATLLGIAGLMAVAEESVVALGIAGALQASVVFLIAGIALGTGVLARNAAEV